MNADKRRSEAKAVAVRSAFICVSLIFFIGVHLSSSVSIGLPLGYTFNSFSVRVLPDTRNLGADTCFMFARKLRVQIEEAGGQRPCPLDWLDRFFMRNFTGVSALDSTLPVADGRIEAGFDVDLRVLHEELERWLRGHKLLAAQARLRITTEQ